HDHGHEQWAVDCELVLVDGHDPVGVAEHVVRVAVCGLVQLGHGCVVGSEPGDRSERDDHALGHDPCGGDGVADQHGECCSAGWGDRSGSGQQQCDGYGHVDA